MNYNYRGIILLSFYYYFTFFFCCINLYCDFNAIKQTHIVGIHGINEYKLLCLLMCVFIYFLLFLFCYIKYVQKSNSLDMVILICKIYFFIVNMFVVCSITYLLESWKMYWILYFTLRLVCWLSFNIINEMFSCLKVINLHISKYFFGHAKTKNVSICQKNREIG